MCATRSSEYFGDLRASDAAYAAEPAANVNDTYTTNLQTSDGPRVLGKIKSQIRQWPRDQGPSVA